MKRVFNLVNFAIKNWVKFQGVKKKKLYANLCEYSKASGKLKMKFLTFPRIATWDQERKEKKSEQKSCFTLITFVLTISYWKALRSFIYIRCYITIWMCVCVIHDHLWILKKPATIKMRNKLYTIAKERPDVVSDRDFRKAKILFYCLNTHTHTQTRKQTRTRIEMAKNCVQTENDDRGD